MPTKARASLIRDSLFFYEDQFLQSGCSFTFARNFVFLFFLEIVFQNADFDKIFERGAPPHHVVYLPCPQEGCVPSLKMYVQEDSSKNNSGNHYDLISTNL